MADHDEPRVEPAESVMPELERRLLADMARWPGRWFGADELRVRLRASDEPMLAAAPLVVAALAELERQGKITSQYHDRPADPAALARTPVTPRLYAVPAPAPTVDPDRPCAHLSFGSWAEVNRITAPSDPDGVPIAYALNLRVACSDCGEPFRFTGLEAGQRADRPMVSVDELELRAPIRPASADPDFGLGIPGFAIRMRPPDGQ